jgi:hypothetical protein
MAQYANVDNLPNSGFVGDRAYSRTQLRDVRTFCEQKDDVEKGNGTHHVEAS